MGAGAAELTATSALTGATWTIASGLAPGERDVRWDTTALHNGDVTVKLEWVDPVGSRRVLEVVDVTVSNTQPMQVAAFGSASQTALAGGFAVLHGTGALGARFDDVQLRGFGGVEWGLHRSYNSQNLGSGPLGVGWHLSSEQSVVEGRDGFVTYIDDEGHRWPFQPAVGGGFDASQGQVGLLRRNPDPLTSLDRPWQMVWPNGRVLTFEIGGRLVREQWPSGVGVTYGPWAAQPSGGSKKLVADDAGHTLELRADVNGRLTSVVDPIGRTTTYAYDTAGRLTAVSNDDGDVAQTYSYLGASMPVIRRVVLPRNGVLEIDATDPASDDAESFRRVTEAQLPNSLAMSFSYASMAGEPVRADAVNVRAGDRVQDVVVNEQGQQELLTIGSVERSTEYNDLGQITETATTAPDPTDPDSAVTTVESSTEYSSRGVVLAEIDGEGNETLYQNHDAFGNARTIVDPAFNETTYVFDAIGRKLSETPPDSGTTAWTYDGMNPLPTSMDPPAGATIEYAYSDTGQVTDQRWTDSSGDVHHVERAVYDDAGQLTSVRTGELPATEYEYDASGRTTKVTDPLGNEVVTRYTVDGLADKFTDARQNSTSTTYDSSGLPIVVTDPLGYTKISHYDNFGNVEMQIDERGHATRMTYDAFDQLRTSTDPLDRVNRYGYDALGNQSSETDGENFTISYSFDKNGNETGSLHPDYYTTLTRYTKLQNVDAERDLRGYWTSYGYDGAGRETSVTNAENETTRTGYDANGRVEWTEDATQFRTQYALDPMGRVIRTTRGATETESTWDDAGRERSRTDARDNVTVLSYDDAGRVLSEQRPDGTQATYTYDENGNRLTEENALGEVIRHDYDELNRRTSTTNSDGTQTVSEYDEAGNLSAYTTTTSGRTTYEYDDANQRTKMTTAAGDVTEYAYEGRGLLKRETTDTKQTEYFYDAHGNLQRVETGDLTTRYVHNEAGNVVEHRLPDGTLIEYLYDKVGRKVWERHSVRGVTTWTYDPNGRIKTETTPAGVTTYNYDDRGRVETITYPGNLVAGFAYDDDGNLLTVTDWNGTRSFTRDAGGRVESFTTLQGKTGSRTYDNAGRITAQTYFNLRNQLVTQGWTYDSLGRLETFNTGRGTIEYGWGEQGQIGSKTYPDGVQEQFTYDDQGRIHRQWTDSAKVTTYHYDTAGRVSLIEEVNEFTGDNKPLHRYTYTPSGQLATWWYLDDAYRTTYTYTSQGALESFSRTLGTAPSGTNTAAVDAAIATCFQPDGMLGCHASYQQHVAALTVAVPLTVDPTTFTTERAAVARYLTTHPMRIRYFAHDSAGRVTALHRWNYTAPYSLNREWNYDNMGRQTSKNSPYQITYDYASRPTRFDEGTPEAAIAWTHDSKIDHVTNQGDTDTLYDYDPEGRLLGTLRTDGSQFTMTDYAFDQWGLAAVSIDTGTGPVTRFPTFNHRGDVTSYHWRNGPESSGFPLVRAEILYTPWGEVDNNTTWSSLGQLPLYGGRDGTLPLKTDGNPAEQDYWMGARTYNAIQGRFRQVDPLPGQAGLSDTAYSYAANDAINRIDPGGTTARKVTRPGAASESSDVGCTPGSRGWDRLVKIPRQPDEYTGFAIGEVACDTKVKKITITTCASAGMFPATGPTPNAIVIDDSLGCRTKSKSRTTFHSVLDSSTALLCLPGMYSKFASAGKISYSVQLFKGQKLTWKGSSQGKSPIYSNVSAALCHRE